MSISKKNGKIELLRFIFSIIIMMHHSRYLLGNERCWFLGGSFAVEFFFIVSGYLMMATIEKQNREVVSRGLGKETFQFLAKKVKAIYPEVFVSWVIAVLLVSVIKNNSIFATLVLFIDTFFEATLLKMSGLHSVSVNTVTWYISSMLLSMMIMYPLIRKFPDISTYVVIPLITMILLGYLCGELGSPRNPMKWIGFTYKGNLRAFAEIGLGVIAYKFVEYLSTITLTLPGKIVITLTEWGCYIILIMYMFFEKAGVRDYFFLFVMVLAVSLSFAEKGIDSNIFHHPFVYVLGRFSIPLYLGHIYYAQHLTKVLSVQVFGEATCMLIYVLLSVVTALIIWGGRKNAKNPRAENYVILNC